MNTYLKRFRLTFTVEGPVFVGSGEKRTAKEYVVGQGSVYFPDMDRLYAEIADRGKAASFERFMLDQVDRSDRQQHAPRGSRQQRGGRGQRRDAAGQKPAAQRLETWLQQNGMWPPRMNVLGGYGVGKSELIAKRARPDRNGRHGAPEEPKFNEIHAFIKDAYGKPYVPGSSVKGLLRTMYLEYRLLAQKPGTPGAFPIPTSKREAEGAATKIENHWLRRLQRPNTRPDDAVNDLFQAIRVTDSSSFVTTDLVICQKIDGSARGEVSGLPLHRECLKPGTSITIDLTVDLGLWCDGANFIRHVAQVAQSINEKRYVPYVNKYEIDGLTAAKAGPYVYLGGGSGFRSKTIVNDQATMSRILDGQFNGRFSKRPVPHEEKTKQLGVSPLALKLTKVGGKLYEMGKCRLSVEPVD